MNDVQHLFVFDSHLHISVKCLLKSFVYFFKPDCFCWWCCVIEVYFVITSIL